MSVDKLPHGPESALVSRAYILFMHVSQSTCPYHSVYVCLYASVCVLPASLSVCLGMFCCHVWSGLVHTHIYAHIKHKKKIKKYNLTSYNKI